MPGNRGEDFFLEIQQFYTFPLFTSPLGGGYEICMKKWRNKEIFGGSVDIHHECCAID